ncbi:MAG: RNA methyltransferase, partial [Lancefieldella rimae]|nr:RNA methyltransferase [Lancefieldella rimae]
MTTDIQEFFATCPKGFEQLLGCELSKLSISQIRPLSGQVSFRGTLADAYRVCLWSRLASRVVLVLGRISATQADELYAGASEIDWEAHISPHTTFAVNAHGTNNELRNAHFTAIRVKDAIVDQLVAKRGSRPMVNTEFPDVTVTVRITKTHASLGIDLAGDPLFKRGIVSRRTLTQNLAPLRPDYAAALLAAHGIYGGN